VPRGCEVQVTRVSNSSGPSGTPPGGARKREFPGTLRLVTPQLPGHLWKYEAVRSTVLQHFANPVETGPTTTAAQDEGGK
jgi:hypothetical protein